MIRWRHKMSRRYCFCDNNPPEEFVGSKGSTRSAVGWEEGNRLYTLVQVWSLNRMLYHFPSSISILRLGCSLFIRSTCLAAPGNAEHWRVNPRQATLSGIILYTFVLCLYMPSSHSRAGNLQVCDRCDAGRRMLHMSRPSELPTAKDCRNILNNMFLG